MIPQSQLSKLSNRLLKENGGRRIPEHILERDYCIAWFLTGLARTPLRDKLVFKGGTALRRCHFADYRFSEDLDFTLLQPLSFEEIKLGLEQVYREIKQESNITFQFSRLDSVSHKNSYTFYLMYEGPLPATLCIPAPTEHRFRQHPNTDSGSIRTLVPEPSEQRFR